MQVKFTYYWLVMGLVLIMVIAGCSKTMTPEQPPLETNMHFPTQADWVDYGTIFEAGVEGEWDYYLWGGFAFSVLEKDETYFLYYQGSSDYRTEFDETVLWRAIGVATSQDSIHFSKHENNPVLTWFPNDYGEEGAVSSGVTLDGDGNVTLFYGANTKETFFTINADGRAASSVDGLTFTDLGVALARNDRTLWGRGDEIFPVDAIYHDGQWVVYYIPNGRFKTGELGVAYGPAFDELTQSASVLSGGEPVSVWGTAGHVRLENDLYALTLNNVRENRIEVRLMSLKMPTILSEPVAIYQFEQAQQAVLFLDEENAIWYLYYRAFDNRYGVMLAPAEEGVVLPPLTP